MCGKGGHVWQRGACVAGGCAWQGCMRGRRDSHCSGRYTSYWNAFLLILATAFSFCEGQVNLLFNKNLQGGLIFPRSLFSRTSIDYQCEVDKWCDPCYHGHRLHDNRIYNRLLLHIQNCFEYCRTRAHSSHIPVCAMVLLVFPSLLSTDKTSSYPGWIKSLHVVTLGILKILDLNSLTIFGWGGGYFGVNFGHPKSEVFQSGGEYFGVNFGHPKSEVFQKRGGYIGVNFDHPKSEVFQKRGGGLFRSKL